MQPSFQRRSLHRPNLCYESLYLSLTNESCHFALFFFFLFVVYLNLASFNLFPATTRTPPLPLGRSIPSSSLISFHLLFSPGWHYQIAYLPSHLDPFLSFHIYSFQSLSPLSIFLLLCRIPSSPPPPLLLLLLYLRLLGSRSFY
ncbi:hypothetical protein BKA57DRAFT_268587 [Linnemannia elongata]|nr:hypothetical protein BKA57DRAFT_268587 [Linnemannia elongata]